MSTPKHVSFEMRTQGTCTDDKFENNVIDTQEHCFTKWTLTGERRDGAFYIILSCSNYRSLQPWQIDCSVTYSILKRDTDDDQTKTLRFMLEPNTLQWRMKALGRYADIQEYADDAMSVTLHAVVTIFGIRGVPQKPRCSFAAPRPPLTDICLKLHGTRFYVSKALLAVYSPVLRDMFAVTPARTEYQLDEWAAARDITAATASDFEALLAIIHRNPRLTVENVAGVCEWADAFKVEMALRECHQQLLECDPRTMSTATLIVIADRYKFDDLMRKLVENLKSVEPLSTLDIEKLHHQSLHAILRRLSSRR